MSGAPKGNQNARRAKELRDALNYALNNFENSAIKKGQALRALGNKLVEMGLDGNLAAIKEIADRIDGKPAQTTIIEDDNRDIEDFNIDELQQLLADGLRKDGTKQNAFNDVRGHHHRNHNAFYCDDHILAHDRVRIHNTAAYDENSVYNADVHDHDTHCKNDGVLHSEVGNNLYHGRYTQ